MTLIRPIVLNGPAEPTASPTEPARAASMRYRHLTDLRGRCARGGLWAAVTASMVFAASTDLAAQSYHLSSPAPASQHIRISNSTGDTATFALKLNGRGYRDIDDVLAEIVSSADDYPGEPEYRKAWRFIRGRIRHASPLTGAPWYHAPTLMLNSTAFGFCDDKAHILAYVWQRLGHTARVWSLEGHVVPEVLVGERWAMFDPYLGVYYYPGHYIDDSHAAA